MFDLYIDTVQKENYVCVPVKRVVRLPNIDYFLKCSLAKTTLCYHLCDTQDMFVAQVKKSRFIKLLFYSPSFAGTSSNRTLSLNLKEFGLGASTALAEPAIGRICSLIYFKVLSLVEIVLR